MTTREESKKALADMLLKLHNTYQETQKRDDEFTLIEYAETNGVSLDRAALEIAKLLKLNAIVFVRKCIFRDKTRNAYKFKE